MADHSYGRKRRVPVREIAAWTVAAAGAAAILFALTAPSGKGIPGWQPVNGSLRATLAAADSPAPSGQPGEPSAGTSKDAFATAPSSAPAASSPLTTPSEPPVSETVAPSAPTASLAPSESGIDLNAATEAELDGLPGIGPSKAKAILAYREEHGHFRSVDELLEVKGIGPKLLERIRPLVHAGTTETGK